MHSKNPLYKDTITIFNRKSGGAKGDTWYPTVIRGVYLNIDRASIIAKYGSESQDSAVLHIPYTKIDGAIQVAGKPYMPPKGWDQTIDSLTFNQGEKFDFFWKGEWERDIVVDSDYSDEGFYDHMNRTRDFVFAISSVAEHWGFGVLPHFEIMGR